MIAANIDDLRIAARKRLPRALFDFIDGGAQDELTLAANVADLQRINLRPRVLVDVAERSRTISLFGRTLPSPLILAPAGLVGVAWPRGEVVAAQAARALGAEFCLSTLSTCTIEEVAAVAPGFWFQLYMMQDRGLNEALIMRARDAGCGALCVTVDLPVPGRKLRDMRSGLSIPFRPTPRLIFDFARHPRWAFPAITNRKIGFANLTSMDRRGVDGSGSWRQYFPGATWKEVGWIRSVWNGPLIVKGVLTPEDAKAAAEEGADAVVVSNHGGRQLDGVTSTIEALPPIVEALGGRIEILFDGGIRRGTDVIKALAKGARACLIGRAFLYGLAAAGRPGVERALALLHAEIDAAQAMLGIADLSRIDGSCLVRGAERVGTTKIGTS